MVENYTTVIWDSELEDIEKQFNYDIIESEVADVFYVLSCVCNRLNIDIFNCVKEKIKKYQ